MISTMKTFMTALFISILFSPVFAPAEVFGENACIVSPIVDIQTHNSDCSTSHTETISQAAASSVAISGGESMNDDFLETIRGGNALFTSTPDAVIQLRVGIILWDEVEEYNRSKTGTLTKQTTLKPSTQRR